MNFAKNQKAWSDAGYWREDVLNYSGSVLDELKEGLTGAHQHHTQTWLGNRHLVEEKQPGADTQFFWFGKEMDNLVKLNITHGAMAVAAKSENPERALMVYDLMRNDPEIYRLLTLGIEGQQYVINELLERRKLYGKRIKSLANGRWDFNCTISNWGIDINV